MTDLPGVRKRVSWTVTDETADPPELGDPDAITVLYGRVGDDPTEKTWPGDAAIVHDETGMFHIDIDCPDVGRYAIDIRATSGIVGATEATWRVSRPAFAET